MDLHHPDDSKEPDLLLLAPLILKQVLGELELLDLHGQAEVTGVHLQPGGEGGADDRDTDAALDSRTGTGEVTGDTRPCQGGEGGREAPIALCQRRQRSDTILTMIKLLPKSNA